MGAREIQQLLIAKALERCPERKVLSRSDVILGHHRDRRGRISHPKYGSVAHLECGHDVTLGNNVAVRGTVRCIVCGPVEG